MGNQTSKICPEEICDDIGVRFCSETTSATTTTTPPPPPSSPNLTDLRRSDILPPPPLLPPHNAVRGFGYPRPARTTTATTSPRLAAAAPPVTTTSNHSPESQNRLARARVTNESEYKTRELAYHGIDHHDFQIDVDKRWYTETARDERIKRYRRTKADAIEWVRKRREREARERAAPVAGKERLSGS